MHPRLLLTVLLAVPVTCCAATTTWETFDYKNCKHWSITDDYEGRGEAFQKAGEVWEKLNQSGAAKDLYVQQGTALFETNSKEYGVCYIRSETPRTIECSPDTEFPLAGATFTEQESNTFKCTKGCEKLTFNMLYEMGYEDGPDSKYWGQAARKFESVCHEKQRKKEFFDRLHESYSK
jgi:hypothetical protein